jgi:hypothetical protein
VAGIDRREVRDRTDGWGPHGNDMRERRHQLQNAQMLKGKCLSDECTTATQAEWAELGRQWPTG